MPLPAKEVENSPYERISCLNPYAMIIAGTLIAGYVINLLADRLNLRALRDEVPDEFRDTWDADVYRKSQQYTRERTRFGAVSHTVSLTATLMFWFAGGFDLLDGYVRQVAWSSIGTGILYIGILAALRTLLSLPFSVYSVFVIEGRYGFNKTTVRTFMADLLKGTALTVLLGTPLLAALLWFFETAGEWAWVYAWLAVTGYSLAVTFIAPTWIMPLFNKFTPLADGELRRAILDYAAKMKFPIKDLYVMDGSKRSAKSNAFFTGFGRNKRIALFDTLIEKHSVTELLGVVAHEIGHYKKRHLLKGMALGVGHTGIVLWLLSVFLVEKELFEAFGMEAMSVYAGLIFFGLLFTPVDMLLSIVLHWISRRHEFEADRFAADTTGEPGALISALKKLSAHNLSNLTPHPFYVVLHYSHPPLLQRIHALRQPIMTGSSG